MKRLLGLVIALWAGMAEGATLLPNGQQQFINGNGVPYAGGKVWFYSNFPTCSVLKNTWSDSAGTVLNTNPVTLDSAGRATIFGSGAYCQVLKDSAGNTVWTKYTSDTSSASNLGWGGTSGGTANAQTVSVSTFTGVNGQTFYFMAGATNTGALTLTVNGSTYAVVKDVATGPSFLTGGEVVVNNIIGVTYDSTSGRLHLITNNVQQFGNATNVPASTTMDLNAAASHVVNATGSGATVTSFGPGGANATANSIFFVTFAGSNTITYNATSLITPNAGNMVIQAGDSLIVSYLGSGNWKVLGILPASNASGGLNVQTGTTYTVLATDAGKVVTISNAAAIAVTLPQATGSFGLGYKTTIQNAGSTLVTVTPTTSTVNGTTALVIGPKEAATFISDGTNWIATTNAPLPVTLGTVATTSGASVTFTGIPPWARRVEVNFVNVSFGSVTPGSSLMVRVGPASGLAILNYSTNNFQFTGVSGQIYGLGAAPAAGFILTNMSTDVTDSLTGTFVLTLADAATNTWVSNWNIMNIRPTAVYNNEVGSIALAGPLSQLQITTTVGPDVFDAGLVNLTYY